MLGNDATGVGERQLDTVLLGFCTTASLMGMARGAAVLHTGFSPIFRCLNPLRGISQCSKAQRGSFQ